MVNLIKKLLFCVLLTAFLPVIPVAAENTATVIYVPGWRHHGSDPLGIFSDEKELLNDIYHPAAVEVFTWKESDNSNFRECCEIVDEQIAARLLLYLTENYSGKLHNVILVGHSLGGRTVIRTMAMLNRRELKIRRGVFLGSAIPYNDGDIETALNASLEKCVNLYSPDDYALRAFRALYGDALGNRGSVLKADNLLQFQVNTRSDHAVLKYLGHLKELPIPETYTARPAERPAVPITTPGEIKVLHACNPLKNRNIRSRGRQVAEIRNWRLIKWKGRFYIFDDRDCIRAYGDEQKMTESFNHIRKQLEKNFR